LPLADRVGEWRRLSSGRAARQRSERREGKGERVDPVPTTSFEDSKIKHMPSTIKANKQQNDIEQHQD
jgi:hypothetical protein